MRLTRLQEFIQFCIKQKAIQFGELKLKSGRKSPYFFNSGLFNTGPSMIELARAYAQSIVDSRVEFDMLFGPAYKGIPLVVSVSMILSLEHGIHVPFAFDRKEAKGHGEGGVLVGAPVKGRVLLIDDVSTNGATKRDSAALIANAGGELAGIVLALDRQERGMDSDLSAVQELERDLGVPVWAAATFGDLIDFLEKLDPTIVVGHHNTDGWAMAAQKVGAAMREYQKQYGVV